MIGNLLLFAVLLLISRRQEKREAGYFPGFIFWLYVGFYCLLRIVVEAFRESQIFCFWLVADDAGMVFVDCGGGLRLYWFPDEKESRERAACLF